MRTPLSLLALLSSLAAAHPHTPRDPAPATNNTTLREEPHCSGREMRDDWHTGDYGKAIKQMNKQCTDPLLPYLVPHDNYMEWWEGKAMIYWCNYSPVGVPCGEAVFNNASVAIDAACGQGWGGWVYYDDGADYHVSVGRDPEPTWECWG